MNVTLTFSPEHRIHDRHRGQYVTISDALTRRTVGRFQLVTRNEGTTCYRAMDGTPYPEGLDSRSVVSFAIDDQLKRRVSRPPLKKRPGKVEPPRKRQDSRPPDNMRPLNLPQDPAQWLRRPPEHAHPMRRRLCEKLAERAARKAMPA